MRRKRRTEITIETERVVVIRQRRGVGQGWCDDCAQPVTMVTAEEAAAVAGVTRRTIYRWVEAEKVHFTETSDGSPLICLNSIREQESGIIRRWPIERLIPDG
jgi:excisionase family DNA binding protein